jgi:hypothetical protein
MVIYEFFKWLLLENDEIHNLNTTSIKLEELSINKVFSNREYAIQSCDIKNFNNT